jgi:hypothetical protein
MSMRDEVARGGVTSLGRKSDLSLRMEIIFTRFNEKTERNKGIKQIHEFGATSESQTPVNNPLGRSNSEDKRLYDTDLS